MNKKSDNKSFKGVFSAVSIPLHSDLSCNYAVLADHCQDLLKRGASGIALFGTTGEGASFSVKERVEALQAIIKLGVNPQNLIFGVITTALDDAVSLIKSALENHCAAVLVAPPFYFKNVSDDGVIAFYREVIKRIRSNSACKMILYHIPQLTGVSITLPVIKTLFSEFPDIVVGIKESEGNLALTQKILQDVPNFKVFVGNESQLIDAVKLGASGTISGLANVFPELVCSLYECENDEDQINSMNDIEAVRKAIKQYPTFPAIKSLIKSQKGEAWKAMRPPLMPLDDQQSHALFEQLPRSLKEPII